MKTLFTFLFILFIINLSAKPGFLITISYKTTTTVHRVTDFNHVNDIIQAKFSFKVDPEKVFAKNNFFDFRINNTLFYCEKREVAITKRGKVKFKKLKKH